MAPNDLWHRRRAELLERAIGSQPTPGAPALQLPDPRPCPGCCAGIRGADLVDTLGRPWHRYCAAEALALR